MSNCSIAEEATIINNNVILVSVEKTPLLDWEIEELNNLAKSADYKVVGFVFQKREKPDGRYYIGSGKLLELKSVAMDTKACKIIFDNELSGNQFHNLEKELGIDVIDRTMLIIEIFSKHAVSTEGKLQVDLMYKKKMLPRVMGQGLVLSQQGGGGAGGGGARRGAGEQQKELDKRTIREEIRQLETKIDKVSGERTLRRKQRQRNRCFTISLVGYTNSGKSTLMNALTLAETIARDELFVTLDPISRKIKFEFDREILLIDTVGFISRLPHDFVKAFRATLEETVNSDLILHVVDGSSPVAHEQYNIVNSVLSSIGVSDIPTITVVNKADKGFFSFVPHSDSFVVISAKTGLNLDKLKALIHSFISKNFKEDALKNVEINRDKSAALEI